MKNYTGSDLGQDFKTFYAKDKKSIGAQLKAMGCTNLQMSRQFYYYSGFFTAPSGQAYYFSLSDVRFFPNSDLLYRTAKNYKDFSGGANCYVNKGQLAQMRLA